MFKITKTYNTKIIKSLLDLETLGCYLLSAHANNTLPFIAAEKCIKLSINIRTNQLGEPFHAGYEQR